MTVNPEQAPNDPAPAVEAAPDAAPAAPDAGAAPADPSLIGDAGGEGGAPDPAAPASDADGDGEAGGSGEDGVDPAAPAEAAPYEGLTAPEGTTLHEEDLAAAAPLMRQFGVPDDQGQAFLDAAAPVIGAIVNRAIDGLTTQMTENRVELTRQWVEEIRADPVVGGANFDRQAANVALFRDNFVDADTMRDLTESGYANNPGLYRAFAKAGAALSEAEIHRGEVGQQKLTTAQKLYDPAFQPKS